VTGDHYSDELVRCPQCSSQRWHKESSQWSCPNGHTVPVDKGLPNFSLSSRVQAQDRKLIEHLYDGVLGRYYGFMMPLLSLPARPIAQSLPQWTAFFAAWLVLMALTYAATLAAAGGHAIATTLLLLGLAACALLLFRHPYLFWLLLVAIPVKLQLARRPYRPAESFPDVHRRWVGAMAKAGCTNVLDVSTGTCNSLLRHGWASIDARRYGVDLSITMLLQGAANAARAGVPIQLYVADAQSLPFPDDCMDLVLNYGALNGYQDQAKALAEMARVLKPGGILVCLDEQLYDRAGGIERLYFLRVLASHDMVTRFAREVVPKVLSIVELHQIYQFYFLAILKKGNG
jgi:SAM-dependent methyltransferase